MLRALFAHAPADRVHDVRLAATVRSDDPDHVVIEVDDGSIDERLESCDFKLFDVHCWD
jgi:hypothetical protein